MGLFPWRLVQIHLLYVLCYKDSHEPTKAWTLLCVRVEINVGHDLEVVYTNVGLSCQLKV